MENVEKNSQDMYTIDLLHIAKALWQRIWLIILCGALAGAVGFVGSAFLLTPQYSSSVLLYVNNNSTEASGNNNDISSSDLVASQGLVKTYSVILNNRTTLESVIAKSGTDLTATQLSGVIECKSTNDTEVMKVTVTTDDPFESAEIANAIADVLPGRISSIIQGTSMVLVDSAVPNENPVSPSITKYTAIGLLLGVFLSAGVLAVLAIMDNTIHSEDYILNNYDFPILAKIPDLLMVGSGHYKYKKYKYYYTHDEVAEQNAETAKSAK